MQTRRSMFQRSLAVAGMLAACGLFPELAHAYRNAAFRARTVQDAIEALGGSAPVESRDLAISGPDIAENGADVPLGVRTTLSGVTRLLILVEKNPSTLVAVFNTSDAVDADFSIRVKMGQSSDVYAVAMTADGQAFFARREVKVTLGGCGG